MDGTSASWLDLSCGLPRMRVLCSYSNPARIVREAGCTALFQEQRLTSADSVHRLAVPRASCPWRHWRLCNARQTLRSAQAGIQT
eukprot:symbB.v1.2.010777.t1/scaffold709.1/size267679/20